MKYFAIPFIIFSFTFTACNNNPSQEAETKVQKQENAQASLSGEALFEKKCMICHIKTKTSPHMRTLSSPPMTGVAYHMKRVFLDTITGEINRKAAFDHVMNYVFNPDLSHSICDSSRINEYGLMPSLKGSLTEDELEKITNYFLDNFLMKEYKAE